MTTDASIAHFDRLYRDDPDPWNYRTSDYERGKYAATLGALAQPRYQSAIEAGCANGELGARIATRCERYLGLDCAERAVVEARRRLAHLPQARVRRCHLPHAWPKRRADLIVLSEILYYLDPDELRALAGRVQRTLLTGGEIVIVNWTGETDTPLSGRAATGHFVTALEACCRVTLARQESGYDLVLLRCARDGLSD